MTVQGEVQPFSISPITPVSVHSICTAAKIIRGQAAHSLPPSSTFSPMPPLTRQDTRTSIFSWWSDSNSLLRYGPTINLDVAAKPLMKLMYHYQALEFIRKNRGIRLSTRDVGDILVLLFCDGCITRAGWLMRSIYI
jgi:hypothetical protein